MTEDLLRRIPGYDPISTAGECVFDAEAGELPIRFFRDFLQHVKGGLAGKPFDLLPWQQAILANLFGWKKPNGKRRYRECFIMIPRKNGKTTLVAGIALFVLAMDGEPGAECYAAAKDREQAGLIFSIAKGMVASSPMLAESLETFRNSIVLKDTASFFKPVSSDVGGKHGFNAHLLAVDELHAQENRELVDVLQTSTGARRQPLLIYITTSDYHRESICNEKYEYACKVRDGIIKDPGFLPVIYEALPGDDYRDPAVWAKANPCLGYSLEREYVERECKRAEETPSYENTFKRLQLNVKTEQDVRWIPIEKWDACDGPVDAKALEGRECYAGLDLASTADVTALSLVFPEEDGGYSVLPFFWLPEMTARERGRQARVPYEAWARDGFIKLTDGNVADYDVIRADITEISKKFNIREIAFDRWNATQITTQLTGDGLSMVQFGQGFASMSSPAKDLERAVVSRTLRHGGNPVLRWMASNVSAEIDAAGNVKPSRRKSSEKIDGIVAMVMGIGRAQMRQAKPSSVYSGRGLIVL